MSDWNVVDIESSIADEQTDEPLGTKEKFWVTDPTDGHPWLFKFAREGGGEVRGEDWAEWIVHQLAAAMGIPTATVRPAMCVDRRGIVSRSVLSGRGSQRLVHGNSLLQEKFPSYDAVNRRLNPEYTVPAVEVALDGVSSPAGWSFATPMSGFDVWAGYAVLDSLVAGRDRHHENWAVVSESTGRALSPSFDHGNALGFQESDAVRELCLNSSEVFARWAARGKSHHFAGKPTLVAVAHDALKLAAPAARTYWHQQVTHAENLDVETIVNTVPSAVMSVAARRFVVELFELNRRRLLHEYPSV